jgi:hypothetical protein
VVVEAVVAGRGGAAAAVLLAEWLGAAFGAATTGGVDGAAGVVGVPVDAGDGVVGASEWSLADAAGAVDTGEAVVAAAGAGGAAAAASAAWCAAATAFASCAVRSSVGMMLWRASAGYVAVTGAGPRAPYRMTSATAWPTVCCCSVTSPSAKTPWRAALSGPREPGASRLACATLSSVTNAVNSAAQRAVSAAVSTDG